MGITQRSVLGEMHSSEESGGHGGDGGYMVRGCMAWGHGAALLLCFDLGS